MPHQTRLIVSKTKIMMSELTKRLLNRNRREGCSSVRVGSEPASVTVSSVAFCGDLERAGARLGSTGLSRADAYDLRCDLGMETVDNDVPVPSSAAAGSATKFT